MGVYWKYTMPLLSTLAALVIIVHSAEEDFEEYRRDMQPRTVDTGTTNYEPPWRAVKIEPMMSQTTQSDTWVGSREEPKRRRPLRKRRRRPQASPVEDYIPQESYIEREYRPYNDGNYRPLTEAPHRRRKRIQSKTKNWNDEHEKGRPLRRKGYRKKIPEPEPWNELSEFSDIPSDENLEMSAGNQKPEIINNDRKFENTENHESSLSLKQHYKEDDDRNLEIVADPSEEENEEEPTQYKENEYEDNNMAPIKEDKSLSEFSLESVISVPTLNKQNDQETLQETVSDIKDKKALDPLTLKEILKKSNGKSLSELLHQNNLTLSDLLKGQKEVLSVLKFTNVLQDDSQKSTTQSPKELESSTTIETNISDSVLKETANSNNENDKITFSESPTTAKNSNLFKKTLDTHTATPKSSPNTTHKNDIITTKNPNNINKLKQNKTNANFLRRRLPAGIRMKLRMRPLTNSTYKGQLSRDLMALTTKRYEISRNYTKSKWNELIPAVMNKIRKSETVQNPEKNENEVITEADNNIATTIAPEEIATVNLTFETIIDIETEGNTQTEGQTMSTVPYTTIAMEDTTEIKTTTTMKPVISTANLTPKQNETNLRRQAFANRLKRKKQKQRTATNETLEDHTLKDIFDMANLVSASEFIAKIHPKPTTLTDETESVTMLEDFMTTEVSTKAIIERSTKRPKSKGKLTSSTTMKTQLEPSSTEAAKIEIEEILNDTLVSVSLSRILMERNMTFKELVEHRERGSSHVHLADIFHNASKEPNPPEPFLSKSLIEPISKETYPLRALLEANSHDPTIKPTTEPYLLSSHYINIPIALDFGNNVNENGENSGIVALFKNFTETVKTNQTKQIDNTNRDMEEGGPNVHNVTSRQGRVINSEHDLVTLNEIFSLMQKSQNLTDETSTSTNELASPKTSTPNGILEDIDGDGLIALEDLQHIKNLKEETDYFNDNINHRILEALDAMPTVSIPETIQNNTRSVTVVTASIVGLIAVLFLLTYAAFKWKHQQQIFRRKQGTSEARIPTPVFESRKSNKNSSMRSMSPMLSSNIYSVNTLEKPNGECPEYMWDSLRKPFQ